jgi:hypothetical protein
MVVADGTFVEEAGYKRALRFAAAQALVRPDLLAPTSI